VFVLALPENPILRHEGVVRAFSRCNLQQGRGRIEHSSTFTMLPDKARKLYALKLLSIIAPEVCLAAATDEKVLLRH
jgi:hypothetical protein